MSGTDVKSKIGKQDMSLFNGDDRTFQRRNSAGSLQTLHCIGNDVDVLQVYGDGTTPTQQDLSDAIAGIEGAEVCFDLAPGAWPITSNLTIPSNVTLHLRRGATFSVSVGVTLTLSGPVIAEESTWYSGAGTVTYTAGGGFYPLVDDLVSTAASKGSRLVGVTGQTGKNLGDLFDGGKDVNIKPQNIDAGGTLDIAGASTLAGTLDVTGQSTVANLSASGTLGGKLAFRGALVYLTTSTALTTGTPTSLLFGSESYDTSAIHSIVSSTEKLTVPSGVTRVRLSAQVVFSASAAGTYRRAYIAKNGTSYDGMSYANQGVPTASYSDILILSTPVITVTAGDYFTLVAYQDTGGDLNAIGADGGAGQFTWFAMEIVE
jgi:hypothetical protein